MISKIIFPPRLHYCSQQTRPSVSINLRKERSFSSTNLRRAYPLKDSKEIQGLVNIVANTMETSGDVTRSTVLWEMLDRNFGEAVVSQGIMPIVDGLDSGIRILIMHGLLYTGLAKAHEGIETFTLRDTEIAFQETPENIESMTQIVQALVLKGFVIDLGPRKPVFEKSLQMGDCFRLAMTLTFTDMSDAPSLN